MQALATTHNPREGSPFAFKKANIVESSAPDFASMKANIIELHLLARADPALKPIMTHHHRHHHDIIITMTLSSSSSSTGSAPPNPKP